ncbi:hypothetical protein C0J52_13853 [Blattella germanica]|nr:hypothetical protein C0J52_13853 [Blattella germanica]
MNLRNLFPNCQLGLKPTATSSGTYSQQLYIPWTYVVYSPTPLLQTAGAEAIKTFETSRFMIAGGRILNGKNIVPR